MKSRTDNVAPEFNSAISKTGMFRLACTVKEKGICKGASIPSQHPL